MFSWSLSHWQMGWFHFSNSSFRLYSVLQIVWFWLQGAMKCSFWLYDKHNITRISNQVSNSVSLYTWVSTELHYNFQFSHYNQWCCIEMVDRKWNIFETAKLFPCSRVFLFGLVCFVLFYFSWTHWTYTNL